MLLPPPIVHPVAEGGKEIVAAVAIAAREIGSADMVRQVFLVAVDAHQVFQGPGQSGLLVRLHLRQVDEQVGRQRFVADQVLVPSGTMMFLQQVGRYMVTRKRSENSAMSSRKLAGPKSIFE